MVQLTRGHIIRNEVCQHLSLYWCSQSAVATLERKHGLNSRGLRRPERHGAHTMASVRRSQRAALCEMSTRGQGGSLGVPCTPLPTRDSLTKNRLRSSRSPTVSRGSVHVSRSHWIPSRPSGLPHLTPQPTPRAPLVVGGSPTHTCRGERGKAIENIRLARGYLFIRRWRRAWPASRAHVTSRRFRRARQRAAVPLARSQFDRHH